MQSRVIWLAISQIALQLRLRAGLWQYQLKSPFVERLPVPKMGKPIREALAPLARKRYELHQKTRRRLQDDLGTPDKDLNQKRTAWWDLPDLATLRAELTKVYKRDIPVKDRNDWDDFLTNCRAQHQTLTQAIITREQALNTHVYILFSLTPEEITLLEAATPYPLGTV